MPQVANAVADLQPKVEVAAIGDAILANKHLKLAKQRVGEGIACGSCI